jgi:hypothetical protein
VLLIHALQGSRALVAIYYPALYGYAAVTALAFVLLVSCDRRAMLSLRWLAFALINVFAIFQYLWLNGIGLSLELSWWLVPGAGLTLAYWSFTRNEGRK